MVKAEQPNETSVPTAQLLVKRLIAASFNVIESRHLDPSNLWSYVALTFSVNFVLLGFLLADPKKMGHGGTVPEGIPGCGSERSERSMPVTRRLARMRRNPT